MEKGNYFYSTDDDQNEMYLSLESSAKPSWQLNTNIKIEKNKDINFQSIHQVLFENKVKLDEIVNKELVYYEKLGSKDMNEIYLLHKEWFPIDYSYDYFRNHIKRMGKGKSLVLGAKIKTVNLTKLNYSDNKEYNKKEYFIIGIIIISLRNQSAYLNDTKDKLLKTNNCLKDCFFPIKFGYINTLGVIDEFRKFGIATKLLNKGILELNSNFYNNKFKKIDDGLIAIYLHVIEYNIPAKKFYFKQGFEEMTAVDYYQIGNEKYKASVLVKILNLNKY